MGRGGRGGKDSDKRSDPDLKEILKGILSETEMQHLTLLVVAITEKMYRDMNAPFNSPQIPAFEGEGPNRNWLALALRHHGSSEKENTAPPASFANRPATPGVKQPCMHQDSPEQVSPTHLQELRREAIAFFRKWQFTVLQSLTCLEKPKIEEQRRARGSRGLSRGQTSRGGRLNGRGGAVAPVKADPPAKVFPPDIPEDPVLLRLYPAVPNALWPLPFERRKLLLHIIFLRLLSLHDYNANARIFLVNLTSSLNLPLSIHNEDETTIATGLAAAALELDSKFGKELKEVNKKDKKKWKFDLGATGNGLAEELRKVGVGSAYSGLTAPTAAALLGIMSWNNLLMGSLFGMHPSKTIDETIGGFLREVQDFSFLSVTSKGDAEYLDPHQPHPKQRRLRIVIALGGFMLEGDAVSTPWACLGQQTEVFVVQWELAAVASLGNALETVVRSTAWHDARQQIRQNSIFHCLLKSTWPEPLLKISKIIDNPWSVGMVRAEKVGIVLADAIMRHKIHGERSVSLVGYSLAARAIYTCLMVLAERRTFGLIDSVVLMGTPAPSESRVWVTLKSVVSGRLINAYTEEDYILGFLYRTSNTQFGIAGLQEIHGVNGVENHRVGHLPNGHLSYQSQAAQILRDVRWEH